LHSPRITGNLRPEEHDDNNKRTMSQLLIQQYLNQLETLKRVSGTNRESVVREAFKNLLKGWARSHDLYFVPDTRLPRPPKSDP